MAIVSCYLSVTSTATQKPQESQTNSSPTPHPRQTKIVLPKKKPMKWSTGVAPGDYGGPPTTTKLRKYWGQDEDPLTSDDFIWNKKFMGRMKKLIKDPKDNENDPASRYAPKKEESSGFLSLNRVMSLDSMEVDLTEKLIARSKPVRDPEMKESQASASVSQRWRPAPTRREQEKWDRAAKAATGGSEVLLHEARRTKVDPNISAVQSEEQYLKLKNKLQFLTLGIGGVGILSAYVSYSPEIAASYGAGLLGSLMYMRMLGNSVDSMRTDGAKALINVDTFRMKRQYTCLSVELLVPIFPLTASSPPNGLGNRDGGRELGLNYLPKGLHPPGSSWAAKAIGSCCFGHDLQPVEWDCCSRVWINAP